MSTIDYKLLTKQQQRIHSGLKEIGLSLSNFYSDALRLVHPTCTLESKANLIAHIAREIDGGLRFVFGPKEIKDEILKIVGEDKGNFASVLAAVGKVDPDDALAKEWHSISSKLHKYAHRQQAHKPSRDVEPVLKLWARYEQILSIFIGSYYAVLQRLDAFLAMKDAPIDSLPALENILANEKQAAYFFGNLRHPGWLAGLHQQGFYDIANAPVPKDGQINEWFALRSLFNMAKVKGNGIEVDIKNITESVMDGFLADKIILHPFSIATIANIIIHLDGFGFGERERIFFEKITQNSQDNMQFFTLTLIEELTEKMLALKDKVSLLQFLEFIFGFSTYEVPGFSFEDLTTNSSTRRKPNVDQFHIVTLLHKFGKDIMEFMGEQTIAIAVDSIKRLDAIENLETSTFAFPSIEDSDQTIYSDGWDKTIVDFIRDYAPDLKQEILSKLLDEWLYSNVPILQRLAIHSIRVQFDKFQNKWWAFISADTGRIYIHEPYLLLKETSPGYTTEQLQTTIDWIEKINKVEPWEGQTEENAITNRHYNVRRWLTALSSENANNKTILKKVNADYYVRNNWKIDHPDFDSYSTSSIGPDMPIEPIEFGKMELPQQIQYLQDFVPSGRQISAGEGLSVAFRANVSLAPEKYLFDIDSFLPVHSIYLQGLIEGLTQAINNDRINSFIPAINFIEKKITSDGFINEQPIKWKDKEGLIYRVVDFISAIANKESLEISTENYDQIIRLLVTLLEDKAYQDDSETIQSGYINHSLNSLSGRLHGALFDICMSYANKVAKPEDAVKWPYLAKQYFIKHLTRTGNTAKDYSIVLGSRILLVLYLDKEWVYQNINGIFDQSDPQQFEYTFASAISGIYRPNQGFYKLFKETGLFETALDRYTIGKGTLPRVMVYGLLEWQVWGVSPEDETSIINGIINRANPDQFKELIETTSRNKFLGYQLTKVLWRKMLIAAEGKEGFENVYPTMLWFAEMIPGIDEETCGLIDQTLLKIDNGSRDVYSFTRHIYKVADSNLPEASRIISLLFEKGIAKPNFDHELTAFTRKLFEANQKERANEICLFVADSGSFVLKDLFDEFNHS